jgi:hypothetical protein
LSPWLNPNPAKGPKEDDFPWNYWNAVDSDPFGWVKNPDGSKWKGSMLAFNGCPDLRRASVRAAMVGVLKRFVADRGWDGCFMDMLCPRIHFYGAPVDPSEWEAGHAAFLHELRMAVGPKFLLVGNCGPGPTHPMAKGALNGWMRENFPLQNGGTWESNMLGFSGNPGYLTHGFREPQLNFISIMPNHNNAADDERRANFAICSALMGEGVAVIVGDASDPLRSFRPKRYPIYKETAEGRWGAIQLGGLWYREAPGATVIVNPTLAPITLYGATFAPQSGTIL